MNNKETIEVALDDIIPNRFQPRLSFDENGLNELAESIRQHGIIQPLVLRKIGDKYEIIAGERRYKAAYIAGLTKVPAIIMNLDDNESAEVAIVENIQRRDLSAIEEAKSYKKLLDRDYLTQDELAGKMGKTQATISNKLRLLNLDEKVQEALLNNKISERHARSLLKLENPLEQREILNEIISKRLNVRDTEDLINKKIGKSNDNFVQVSGISNLNIDSKEEDNLLEFPKFASQNIENNELNSQTITSEQTNLNTPIDLDSFFGMSSVDNTNNQPSEEIEEIETIPDEVLPFGTETVNFNNNIDQAIEKINNIVKELEQLGYKVKLEQYDFEKLYQFIIKINKE